MQADGPTDHRQKTVTVTYSQGEPIVTPDAGDRAMEAYLTYAFEEMLRTPVRLRPPEWDGDYSEIGVRPPEWDGDYSGLGRLLQDRRPTEEFAPVYAGGGPNRAARRAARFGRRATAP